LQKIDEVYGRPSLWAEDDSVVLVSGLGASASKLADGVPATLAQALWSLPSTTEATSQTLPVMVKVLVSEKDLVVGGARIESVQGFFERAVSDGRREVSALAPTAAVSGRVDWSVNGRVGQSRRVTFPVEMQTGAFRGKAKQLMPNGARVGTFFLGRPTVVAALLPSSNTSAAQGGAHSSNFGSEPIAQGRR
jgi:hypothetical protein